MQGERKWRQQACGMTQAWQLGNLTLNTASVPYTTTSIVAATRPAITAITLAHYQCCGAFMNLSMGAIKHMYAYKKYICIHTHHCPLLHLR